MHHWHILEHWGLSTQKRYNIFEDTPFQVSGPQCQVMGVFLCILHQVFQVRGSGKLLGQQVSPALQLWPDVPQGLVIIFGLLDGEKNMSKCVQVILNTMGDLPR